MLNKIIGLDNLGLKHREVMDLCTSPSLDLVPKSKGMSDSVKKSNTFSSIRFFSFFVGNV